MNIIKILKVIIRNKWSRLRINTSDFTIISNNCWGGFVYQMLKMKYNTPTIGLFMYATDYVEFCSNIKYYIKQEMKFIEHNDSKYYNEIKNNKNDQYPIGKIDNIEIHFLHYSSKDEAISKWKRRSKRINWEKIIFKFSQRDLCTKADIDKFMRIRYKNKICFTYEENIKDTIYIPKLKNIGTDDETELTLKYFDIVKYINKEMK